MQFFLAPISGNGIFLSLYLYSFETLKAQLCGLEHYLFLVSVYVSNFSVLLLPQAKEEEEGDKERNKEGRR